MNVHIYLLIHSVIMTDFKNKCRACLIPIEIIQYYLCDNVPSDIYWFCTSIEVKPEDTISKALCINCYKQLVSFCDFKNTCIQSYKTLLDCAKHLENSRNNEIKIEIDISDSKILKNETNLGDNKLSNQNKHDESDVISNFKKDLDDDHSIDSNLHNDDISIFAEPLEQTEENIDNTSRRLKINVKRKLLTCDICNRTFVNLKRFDTHKKTHESKKLQRTLQCVPCNKKFSTWCGLRRHEATWHARVRLASVACDTCGKVARSRDSLRAHRKLHVRRNPHICSICGKAYSSGFGLKTHLEIHQENRERRYTCEYCGKKFFTKKTLSGHVTRCHTSRRFICQICNYPFTDKYNLAQHLLIHEGKKLHKCKICDKSFATRFSYEEHQRIHSGERPFDCSYCSKSFLSKKRLNEHHRIHTGEKPHKCSICARGFTQRGTLKRHMKIHEKVSVI